MRYSGVQLEYNRVSKVMNADQLLQRLIGSDSRDEMMLTLQQWLKANSPAPNSTVYAVFAQVRGGVSHDYLAVYSTLERAQALIDAQCEELGSSLVIWPLEIDRDPKDDYWATPARCPELPHALKGPPAEDLQARIERYRPQLHRLATSEDFALVCANCGRAISQIAGYVEQSLLSHTCAPGSCGVCGQVGSVSPSDDWIGEGD